MDTMRTYLVAPIILLCVAALLGCNDGVLNFPQPAPATVRVVNVTQDVGTLGVVIEGTSTLLIERGKASSATAVTSGRPVSFVFKEGDSVLRRDTLLYTLGGSARVILFAKGTKTNLVEFRQAIQDTLVSGAPMAFIRYTHMCDAVDKAGFVQVHLDNGEKLFDDIFQPGFSSRTYAQLAPGTYTFVLREDLTGVELGRLANVSLAAGASYMLYSYDAAPPAVDSIAMDIFN